MPEQGAERRFTAFAQDPTGQAELVWFQGVKWIEKRIEARNAKTPSSAARRSTAANCRSPIPSWKPWSRPSRARPKAACRAIYPSTEKLGNVLGAKGMYQIICNAWTLVKDRIADPLPEAVRTRYGLIGLRDAIYNIHFPPAIAGGPAAGAVPAEVRRTAGRAAQHPATAHRTPRRKATASPSPGSGACSTPSTPKNSPSRSPGRRNGSSGRSAGTP